MSRGRSHSREIATGAIPGDHPRLSYPSPGTVPGRYSPSTSHRAGTDRPRQTACRSSRRAQRTPTPLRSAGAFPPTWRRRRVVVGDMNDWIVSLAIDVALRTERMSPVRALHVRPPLEMIVERHGMSVGAKTTEPATRFSAERRKILRARRSFGHRNIARGLHERGELVVGDVGRVHPEAVHVDAVDRTESLVACMPTSFMWGASCAPIENSPPGIHTMPCGGVRRRGSVRNRGTKAGAGDCTIRCRRHHSGWGARIGLLALDQGPHRNACQQHSDGQHNEPGASPDWPWHVGAGCGVAFPGMSHGYPRYRLFRFLERPDPDVTEPDGIAVVLEADVALRV